MLHEFVSDHIHKMSETVYSTLSYRELRIMILDLSCMLAINAQSQDHDTWHGLSV